ncbi:MAG: S-layer homology domain-containing protein [Erysipelotrichaceae bacterium]|nr:S-layer homology domain-containing protein [Erysipelotrichaceae bacterium]
MKFIFKWIMCLMLALSTITARLIPAEAETIGSGKCGENAEWVLTDDGILTVSGEGSMYSYDASAEESPFTWDRESIEGIIIESGITSVGYAAFSNSANLKQVMLSDSVTLIEADAFAGCDSIQTVFYEGGEAEWNAVTIESGNDALQNAELVCDFSFDDQPRGIVMPSEISVPVNHQVTLPAYIVPEGAEQSMTFTSENPEVAVIERGGVIRGLAAGVIKITAETANGVSAECELTVQFNDVSDETRFFYEPVYWALKNAVTTGTSKIAFSPDMNVTRGQIAAFLYRTAGEPEVSGEMPFKDVKADRYFYQAVLWAVQNNITTGTSPTEFQPDAKCTRAQIVTFLWRYLGEPNGYEPAAFEDMRADAYYLDAVAWASNTGVTTGTSPTKFSPDNSCTRGQAVTFLHRAAADRIDNDSDGLPDELEDLFETDPQVDDSDGDGLSDLEEVRYTGTDPALYDTDGNGVNDGDEDFDGDGISNLEEVRNGTDPLKADTDGDGLGDNEEGDYGTDPTLPDTDDDGMPDGDEVGFGLDPLNPSTDGENPDDERTFEQTLNEGCVEGTLYEDNLLIPSVSGNVPGNIDNHVSVDEADIYALVDNRASVGKAVRINTDYAEDTDLNLTFGLSEDDARNDFYMICSYEDGEVVPCDTVQEGNTISTAVTNGEYFVVDAEKLLIDLGIPIKKYRDPEAVAAMNEALNEPVIVPEAPSNDVPAEWYEENYVIVDAQGNPVEAELTQAEETAEEASEALSILERPLNEGEHLVLKDSLNQTPAEVHEAGEGRIAGQADIVFVIDTTGSMSGAISNVVSNIDSFVDTLSTEYSVNANFALIDYKDITCTGEQTILVSGDSGAWFSDVSEFKSKISSLVVTGGGDGPETPIDALAMAHELDFRQNANKFIILVTDADYKTNNNYGIGSMDEMTDLLERSGIVTSVISSTSYEGIYHNLYTETGGVFGDIYGNFQSVLLQLADNIGEIVNDGSWVLLSDYQFIKLDQPLDDSGYSSDEDGISDADELGDETEKDVMPYISWVLKHYNIPDDMYEDTSTVKVYKYISNPVLPDTDFDGINDDEESADLVNHNTFFANEKYSTGGTSYNTFAIFKMDYRQFFYNPSTFKQELAVLASLFALDMYDDGWIEMNYGASGSSKAENGKSFGEIFGMQDGKVIKDWQLRDTYAQKDSSGNKVDQDDVSEVYFGHRPVEYKNEKREIFFMMVRGTNGTSAEWSSNFDVGSDTSEYYWETGEHPDWKDKANHKGFDVATNRILAAFNDYVSNLEASGEIDVNARRSIFISGHSRGAAIANLLGAYFEDRSDYQSYVYTMAAPYSTTHSDAQNYKTIFNIMNTDDLVPYLPLETWGFRKYGKTLKISAGVYEDHMPIGDAVDTFEFMFGRDYDSNAWRGTAVSSFEKMVDSRNKIHILDTTSGDGEVIEGSVVYFDDSHYYDCLRLLHGGKLYKYCHIKKDVNFWTWPGYNIKITYAPAYAMQIVANLASSPEGYGQMDWMGVDLKGKYSAARRDFALASGKIPMVGWIPGGMESPHVPATYYMITKLTDYSSYN